MFPPIPRQDDRWSSYTAGRSNVQPGSGSSKRQAAREARNDNRPGAGRDETSVADETVQPVQYETDGGVRLAGGRLRPTSEHDDDERGGSSDVGTVLPPPYAEY